MNSDTVLPVTDEQWDAIERVTRAFVVEMREILLDETGEPEEVALQA